MGVRERARLSGEVRYTNNKPCAKGHFSERLVSTGKCIDCKNLENNKRRKLNKYGIKPSEYADLFWKQNGVCAICKEKETVINTLTNKTVALSVDHCHDTGKIRGLLCQRCNIGIGNLKHNPDLLRVAAIYCEKV